MGRGEKSEGKDGRNRSISGFCLVEDVLSLVL